MIDLNEIERRHRPSGPVRGSVRLWLIALAALAVVAFGFGPAVSSAPAKGGGEVTPKVIGGNVAPDGSWPSQAALLASGQSNPYLAQFCGGTLIDPYWVLTAAHCVDFLASPTQLNVAIGINDLGSVAPGDRIGIRSIVINPSYVPAGDPNPPKWDLALLELAVPSDAPVTALIGPDQAALTAGGQPGAVAGWGCVTFLDGGGNCPSATPNSLRQADVTFVADADCLGAGSYGARFKSSMMICAGDFSSGIPDTCKGDSGGPLIAFGPGGERLLAGVTSWGDDCALANFPGVYARVLAGRSWILTTIEENLRLEVTKSGNGSGTVTSSPSGISCGTACSADFSYGTEVTLTAKAASGSGFTGWSGDCSGTGTCVVTMEVATQVGAQFTKGPTVSLKAKPPKRTHKRKATFKFRASQSGSTFRCRLDNKSWQKCKSPRSYKNLKRGSKHTFRIKASKGGITGPVKKYTWYVKRH